MVSHHKNNNYLLCAHAYMYYNSPVDTVLTDTGENFDNEKNNRFREAGKGIVLNELNQLGNITSTERRRRGERWRDRERERESERREVRERVSINESTGKITRM